ncbi:MAG: anaerobic ribonucleoside-triphosphate reductase activating protein [Desulfobacterales bacterium CG23_combo_of_CG06-09_8_20_14_all_51_8]|nr:MAG: anaerobic ribonucleoside-triphosphate reductase activating protein [Desulfobacterales bacterium CG23_combo_of_CG06-09_8_20_14_all_51_8]
MDGVVITGGEPTLHADLPEFCDRIKRLGFLIKLDTNGSSPDMIRSLFETRKIDYIAMDVKTLPENYPPHIAKNIPPETLYESIQIIKTSGISHEFRTTCAPPFVNTEIIGKIARIIEGADLFVLQKATIDRAILTPAFFVPYDRSFTPQELSRFQQAAAPFLKKILIR